ncbi:protein FAM181B [Sorex araneus]|uniref:protein FAM181B n=1 Tax=Sorex araneus TaxID=42254 RepID=UPI0024336173|nr:protein FAM181B [Sorex araneus]
MAVQALPRAPPFAPFGFGAAADALGCAFEDDAPPAGPEGGGDVREATRELLSFMDSASSNIKLALDKPGKSKRKVNHRKYLQKQIKRCSGLMGAAAPGPPSPAAADPAAKRPPLPVGAAGRAGPRRDAAQAAASSLQSRSLAALFASLRPGRAEPAGGACGSGGEPGAGKVPLRARNLPPSFFTEPSPGPGPGAHAGDLLELLGADFAAGPDAGVLLEPLDVFAPEPGLFAPPAGPAGSLPYPAPADDAAFAACFPDCALPAPPPAAYECGAYGGLWRPEPGWDGAPGAARRD